MQSRADQISVLTKEIVSPKSILERWALCRRAMWPCAVAAVRRKLYEPQPTTFVNGVIIPTPLNAMQLPVLELHPVENTFLEKRIALIPGERVRLGREIGTRADRIASEENGYFPSKTLSRQHAEIWEDNGKVRTVQLTPQGSASRVPCSGVLIHTSFQIFVRDVGSINGTYLNGERLSLEAVQSVPFELTSGDIMVRIES